MSQFIGLPLVMLESVKSIAVLNGYIDTYSKDKKILTPEDVTAIFDDYDGNFTKYLDLSNCLIQHAVRNKAYDTIQPIVQCLGEIVKTIDPAEYQLAYNGVIKIKQFMAAAGSSHPALYIGVECANIVLTHLTMMTQKAPSDIESSDLEMMFDNNSDIHFAAVVDAMLEMCQELTDGTVQLEGARMRKAVDAVATKVTRFTMKDREVSTRFNEKFNRFLQDYRENKRVATYDKIVQETFNLSAMLKTLLTASLTGAGVALLVPGGVSVGIVTAVLTVLTKFALDKRTQDKHRKLVLADLKFEKQILQEKIKDAESKGDMDAKYKLMRTENQVSRAIDRVTFGLAQR